MSSTEHIRSFSLTSISPGEEELPASVLSILIEGVSYTLSEEKLNSSESSWWEGGTK